MLELNRTSTIFQHGNFFCVLYFSRIKLLFSKNLIRFDSFSVYRLVVVFFFFLQNGSHRTVQSYLRYHLSLLLNLTTLLCTLSPYRYVRGLFLYLMICYTSLKCQIIKAFIQNIYAEVFEKPSFHMFGFMFHQSIYGV